MRERWRPVAGYEADYEVSDRGRVRRVSRSPNGPRIRKPQNNGTGYLYVVLSSGNRQQNHTIHRMVLKAFVGPPPDGHEAMHLNHNRSDNRLANLKWGTHQENAKASAVAGRLGRRDNEQYRAEVQRRCLAGESQNTIALALDVSRAAVGRIVRGDTYGGSGIVPPELRRTQKRLRGLRRAHTRWHDGDIDDCGTCGPKVAKLEKLFTKETV